MLWLSLRRLRRKLSVRWSRRQTVLRSPVKRAPPKFSVHTCIVSVLSLFRSETDRTRVLYDHRLAGDPIPLRIVVVALVGRRRGVVVVPCSATRATSSTSGASDGCHHLADGALDARGAVCVHERDRTPPADDVAELICLARVVERVAQRALDVPCASRVRQLASTGRVATRELCHVRLSCALVRHRRNERAARAPNVFGATRVHQDAVASLTYDLRLRLTRVCMQA